MNDRWIVITVDRFAEQHIALKFTKDVPLYNLPDLSQGQTSSRTGCTKLQTLSIVTTPRLLQGYGTLS